MPEEIRNINELLTERKEIILGRRTYYTGRLNGVRSVVVVSRIGKVAAAVTITTLILEFGITELIFTGVAGAISPDLEVGDIVIGRRFYQHDMDARPIMKQFEIPLLGVFYFETEESRLQYAQRVVGEFLENKHLHAVVSSEELNRFNIHAPTLHIGDIASGDQFFSDSDKKQRIKKELHSVICVEMEGAAVAQVCFEYHIPFTIIRTISDAADENAGIDFPSFIENVASKYSMEIIKLYFQNLDAQLI